MTLPLDDTLAALRATFCPHCAGTLEWIGHADLRNIAIPWRCLPGQQPRSFVLTCRWCKRTLVAHRKGHEVWFSTDVARDLASAVTASRRDPANSATETGRIDRESAYRSRRPRNRDE